MLASTIAPPHAVSTPTRAVWPFAWLCKYSMVPLCDVWTSGPVVRLTVASWASEPLIACNFTETVPVGVESIVPIRKDCGTLGDRLSGDDGFVVAPGGNSDTATDTVPVKPLIGVTDKVADPLVPPTTALRD